MTRRIIPILIVVVAISAAALGYLYINQGFNLGAGGPAAVPIGGPIRLTDQDGKPFDSASLAGKPYAVFFGFTHCPDACPTTLSEIARTEDEVGAPAKELTTLFITVDPERDTPAALKEYISNFNGNTVALSGTPEQVAEVAKAFRVYYKKVPTSDGGYTMDHTAVLYLMDRDGKFADVISYTEEHERFVAKIKKLLEG
ncbi:SCO family protein [Dongia sp.]|uniref:SCO family protein n=1 Tax=Dongia sp. TaxID=1977262 RepID=UPI00374FEBA9